MKGSMILMYHDIFFKSPAAFIPRSSNIYHISEQNFIEHLNHIKKSKLNVVKLPNLITSEDSISLTFDDGWIGAFNIGIPLLKEFGFKGTFFITKDFVGRRGFIDEKEIIIASEAGMEIGVHGTSHRMLSDCSNDEIIWELRNCKEYLESLTGQNIISASMPGGDWNKNIAFCAKNAGLENLCISSPGINYTYTNPYKLLRMAIKDNTGVHDINRYCKKNISKELIKAGFYSLPKRLLGMKKYSNIRRWIFRENKDINSQIFKP